MQNAFVTAWQGIDKFVAQAPGGFYRWLVAIARNEIRSRVQYVRSKHRDRAQHGVPSNVIESLTSISSLAGRREHLDRMATAIDALAVRDRRIIELVYLQGMSTRDASAELQLPRSTVFDALNRALDTLRAAVGDAGRPT